APFDAFLLAPMLAHHKNADYAAPLYRGLADRRGTIASFGSAGYSLLGPMDALLGDCAVALDRLDDARAHYDDALALCARIGAAGFIPRVEARRGALTATTSQPTSAPWVPAGVKFALVEDGDVW